MPLLKGTFDWRGVPVDPIEIMNRQPGSNTRTGRVFPCFAKHVTTRFTKACKDLNIPDLHFHDLRHEGVSRLFEDGRPMEQVSVVSGHRSWKDLKRYTNLKPKNLHRDTVTKHRSGHVFVIAPVFCHGVTVSRCRFLGFRLV